MVLQARNNNVPMKDISHMVLDEFDAQKPTQKHQLTHIILRQELIEMKYISPILKKTNAAIEH